jgi:hypothetical protein
MPQTRPFRAEGFETGPDLARGAGGPDSATLVLTTGRARHFLPLTSLELAPEFHESRPGGRRYPIIASVSV